MYLHTGRVFVIGPKRGVQACLDHLANPRTEGPLKAAIKEASGTHHLVFAVAPTGNVSELARKGLPEAVRSAAPLFDCQSFTLTGDLNTALDLEVTFTFGDAAKATEGKSAVDALKGQAIKKLAKARKALTLKDPKAKEMFDQLEAALSETKVEQKKDTVVVQIKGDASAIAASLSALLGTGVNRPIPPRPGR